MKKAGSDNDGVERKKLKTKFLRQNRQAREAYYGPGG
jgi:hypothetical protein